MYGYGNSMFLATNGILARANGGAPPVNTVAPVISGTQVVGSSLTTTNGTWTGSPAPTFTYQWYRGATLITGATSSSYTLVQADAGNTSNITCQVTGTNGSGNATATSNTLAQILDADASSFITSASLSDATQKGAINTLAIDLKGYSIWTKMKAIYPMVGGTASTHKWNLKDPRDLDAAFRLVFNGGWTHSSTGALPNGTNAYADTKLLPSSSLSQNSSHLSAYSRTTTANSSDCLIGCYPGSGYGAHRIQQDGGTTSYRCENAAGFSGADFTNSIQYGLFINSRIISTQYKTYLNSSIISTKNINSISFTGATKNIYLSAVNGEFGISAYSKREQAFASIGDGLTDTEAANFYTAVQAFQTTLSRNV